jgi:hypothetical protein
MDEAIPLPAELEFLRQAKTAAIISWLYGNDRVADSQAIFSSVWKVFEKRIREHPDEAGEAIDYAGSLPIHKVFSITYYIQVARGYTSSIIAAPLSLVELLIENYPQGLHEPDIHGNIPLYLALQHPSIECFRAVLYSANVDAQATTRLNAGLTPLHESTWPEISLGPLWELLCYNREYASIKIYNGMTALHSLKGNWGRWSRDAKFRGRQNAKEVLLKLAVNYNYVPMIPSDEVMIAEIESHPSCGVLAPKLEPGKDQFVLHQALAAKCPLLLVHALLKVSPDQTCLQQQDVHGRFPLHVALHSEFGASVRILASAYPAAISIADPVTGHLPIEQALLNAARNESLENADAVDVLLRADPAFLLRNDAWRNA